MALGVFFPSTLIIKALGFGLHWRLVLTAAVPAAVVLALEAIYSKVGQTLATLLVFTRHHVSCVAF